MNTKFLKAVEICKKYNVEFEETTYNNLKCKFNNNAKGLKRELELNGYFVIGQEDCLIITLSSALI